MNELSVVAISGRRIGDLGTLHETCGVVALSLRNEHRLSTDLGVDWADEGRTMYFCAHVNSFGVPIVLMIIDMTH